MEKRTVKSKWILALKIVVAVATAVLGVIGVGSMTSCSTIRSFSISADSLNVTNPYVHYVDSAFVTYPFRR